LTLLTVLLPIPERHDFPVYFIQMFSMVKIIRVHRHCVSIRKCPWLPAFSRFLHRRNKMKDFRLAPFIIFMAFRYSQVQPHRTFEAKPVELPINPAIYHITHLDNLDGIVSAGCLWSDSQRAKQNFACTNIGYSHLKQTRLTRRIDKAAGGSLGDYVPFY
jgi:hypothetical protein